MNSLKKAHIHENHFTFVEGSKNGDKKDEYSKFASLTTSGVLPNYIYKTEQKILHTIFNHKNLKI